MVHATSKTTARGFFTLDKGIAVMSEVAVITGISVKERRGVKA